MINQHLNYSKDLINFLIVHKEAHWAVLFSRKKDRLMVVLS